MLIDKAEFLVEAGHGGAGSVSWMRRKFLPKGGPGGGDGGCGGNVYFRASNATRDLNAVASKFVWRASNGEPGGSNCKSGKKGDDLIIELPVGTVVFDAETREIICDLIEDKDEFLVCKGGDGGLGNYHFRSSTNQAPDIATQGYPGDSVKVCAELKMIADVGLVGFPNAGKSSLMRAISNSKTKIGSYPFTTLEPELGIAYNSQTCVADIPGIIEGAGIGKGLGIAFLQHIERTRVLFIIFDVSLCDLENPLRDFYIIRRELQSYGKGLLNKQYKIVFNKCDLLSEQELSSLKELMNCPGEVFFTSVMTGEGIEELSNTMGLFSS